MAEVEIVSPLYEPGVNYATVRSPAPGTPADPLGVLSPQGNQAREVTTGSGDDVNDWKPTFPGKE